MAGDPSSSPTFATHPEAAGDHSRVQIAAGLPVRSTGQGPGTVSITGS